MPDVSTDIGSQLYALAAELYPWHRSPTGDGVRRTLRRLHQIAPMELHEVPSGTSAFEWTIPDEWNLHDAYIADSRGTRIVDLADSNLHVAAYSRPCRESMTFRQLEPHLVSLPEMPELIPYRSLLFQDRWAFCVSHHVRKQMQTMADNEKFEVVIDASLGPGALTYGELYLPGETTEEVLFSAHVCHPSLANDNLSGLVVSAFLAKELAQRSRRLSYRFLFAPVTIGAIAWLAANREGAARRVRHGVVLACLGDGGQFTYKQSRQGNAVVDQAVASALEDSQVKYELRTFKPWGYDERQFNSPAWNMPVGRLTRTPNGEYPEYHTSADNLDLIRPESLADSLQVCLRIVETLEANVNYTNRHPWCEPQLGRRNLYSGFAQGNKASQELQQAVQWVLNLSDGSQSLLDISQRSGLPFAIVDHAAQILATHELLRTS